MSGTQNQRYRSSCDRTLTDLFRNLATDEAYVSYGLSSKLIIGGN